MTEGSNKLETAFGGWFSSYGLLTVDRVLSYYELRISKDQLYAAIKKKDSALYFFLQVPMKNIFNGIILQQAYDYQVYVMKIMIDYRLSPESSLPSESPGASIREGLDDQFHRLDQLNHDFLALETSYYQFISETQKDIMEILKGISTISALDDLLKDQERSNQVQLCLQKAAKFFTDFSYFREQYYEHIILITERLSLLPDYYFDLDQAKKDREFLHIAKDITES